LCIGQVKPLKHYILSGCRKFMKKGVRPGKYVLLLQKEIASLRLQ
jgi:hypothetical protein